MPQISIVTVRHMFNDRLRHLYPDHEISSLTRLVLEEVLQLSFASVLALEKLELSQGQLERLESILCRLEKSEPLQYILGYGWFAGYRFQVRPGVLIPRNETEELVDWISEDLRRNPSGLSGERSLLDIGCGSGIIAITLKLKHPELQVMAIDKYAGPIEATLENAALLRADIQTVEADMLNQDSLELGAFDVIVSNPPYVTERQKGLMDRHVLDFEPSQALFVSDQDPLLFYRHIRDYSSRALKPGGAVYVEINEELGEQTRDLFAACFKKVEVRRDIHGKQRMVKAYGR